MPGFNIPLRPEVVSGIERFGGPVGNQPAEPSNVLETARQYRFLLSGFKPNEYVSSYINFNVKTIQRPQVQFDEIVIHSGQDEIYRPGKTKWQPIDIVFYETLSSQSKSIVSYSIYDWWSRRMINIVDSTQRVAGVMTPDPTTGFYFNAQIDMLDGLGDVIWSYILYECWPVQVKPGDLDYSATAIADTTVTLRYNRASEL